MSFSLLIHFQLFFFYRKFALLIRANQGGGGACSGKEYRKQIPSFILFLQFCTSFSLSPRHSFSSFSSPLQGFHSEHGKPSRRWCSLAQLVQDSDSLGLCDHQRVQSAGGHSPLPTSSPCLNKRAWCHADRKSVV